MIFVISTQISIFFKTRYFYRCQNHSYYIYFTRNNILMIRKTQKQKGSIMNNFNIFRMAKWIFIFAVISATTLLLSEAKADLFLSEERSIQPESGTLKWMHDESTDNIAQPYFAISEYGDGTLFAAAKDTTQTAKKKTPRKSTSKKTDNNISLSVKAAYLMPMGDWKKLIDPGYGGMLELRYDDLLFKNFTAGIETGYLFASGKNDNVKKESIIPFFATFGYKIPVGANLDIVPGVAAGGGYFTISYKPAGVSEETKSELELMAKGGMSIIYDLSNTLALEAGAEYGMIFEKDGRLPFAVFQLGCNFNF
jgi:hypothetical protein